MRGQGESGCVTGFVVYVAVVVLALRLAFLLQRKVSISSVAHKSSQFR